MGQVCCVRVPCIKRCIERVSWCSSRIFFEVGASLSEREEKNNVLLIDDGRAIYGGFDMIKFIQEKSW